MEGEAKRDYPARILHQSAWWREYKHVENYFSRIHVFMSQGKPKCDVLVLNPIESVWCQVYPGWAQMLEAKSPEILQLENQYSVLFHWLSGAQIDFDYGDEDIVGRNHRLEKLDNGNVRLRIGEASYHVVVLAGMTTIRASTLQVLKAFLEAGGTVIAAGPIPDYVDALPSHAAAIVLKYARQVNFTEEDIIIAINKVAASYIEVFDDEGKRIRDVFCQIREDEHNHYIMLLNTNREKGYREVNILLKMKGFAQEWNCSDGERYIVGRASQSGFIEIR